MTQATLEPTAPSAAMEPETPSESAGRKLAAIASALWRYVLPALLTGVLLKYCVPLTGAGLAGWVASVVHTQPVFSAVTVFLVLSAVARYWSVALLGEARPVVARAPRLSIGLFATVSMVAGIALVLGVRRWIAQAYEVQSSSMLPTLEPGDRIAANKLAYHADHRLPERGDIVVFRSAGVALAAGTAPDLLVKRVIGLPGDRIEMQGGTPVVNGRRVPSCSAGSFLYVIPDGQGRMLRGQLYVEFLGDHPYLTVHTLPMPALAAPYVVREGEVFVLGDNRANSLDSRSWNDGRGGGVPLTGIEGQAKWFLVGTHRGGDADFGRLGRPVDWLQARMHLEGFNADALEDGIGKCLRNGPTETPLVAPSSGPASQTP